MTSPMMMMLTVFLSKTSSMCYRIWTPPTPDDDDDNDDTVLQGSYYTHNMYDDNLYNT